VTESVEFDAIVVGGGVIGLAIARALGTSGREVLLLEADTRLGKHSSSRNSEVIHAGIYYPPASLKAKLCVAGKQRLYQYCAQRDVPHRRVGKLIVATCDEEVTVLESIRDRAAASGVGDLEWIDADELSRLEPELRGVRALLSPSTGILDSHAFMSALRRDAEAAGARIVPQSPVVGGRVTERGFELRVGGPEATLASCRTLVNAAGLQAQEVARSLVGVPPNSIPPQYFAKGHYFTLRGRCPFRHLIYPVPEPGGLGVHVTLDLAGQARFGPDVSWIEGLDYGFDRWRASAFYDAIRRYFPGLPEGALEPGYTGIRPKIAGPGEAASDFLVQGPTEHSVPGLLNLYGIESPGLTSSLSLAEYALSLL